ncbi:MAG: JAB domain-containing protein [Christensenellales bacterium]|jgi:DNA repair protein RadC
MEQEQQKQNLHAGHRKRMRALVEKTGLESLNEVNALEFALTYVLPRKDTNEIAHELLETFGSFAGVFDAPESEIVKLGYLGKESAKMLVQMKEIFSYYKNNKLKQQKQLKNLQEINAFFFHLLEGAEKENLYIMGLDKNGFIKGLYRLTVGTDKLITLDKHDIANFAYRHKVSKLVLSHNHPNASCSPSKLDDESTSNLIAWFNAVGLEMVDHVIVGKDGTFSFRNVGFFTLDELKI